MNYLCSLCKVVCIKMLVPLNLLRWNSDPCYQREHNIKVSLPPKFSHKLLAAQKKNTATVLISQSQVLKLTNTKIVSSSLSFFLWKAPTIKFQTLSGWTWTHTPAPPSPRIPGCQSPEQFQPIRTSRVTFWVMTPNRGRHVFHTSSNIPKES